MDSEFQAHTSKQASWLSTQSTHFHEDFCQTLHILCPCFQMSLMAINAGCSLLPHRRFGLQFALTQCPEGSTSLPATLHVSRDSLCCGQHRFPYHSKSPTHGVPSSPLALLWTLLGLDIASTAPSPLHVSCSSLYCGQLKFLYCSKDSTQGVPSPPLTFPWTLQHCKYCSVPPTQYFLW